MSFASYSPSLAAKDVRTTLEVKEHKDYRSSLSSTSWQPDRYTHGLQSPTYEYTHDISDVSTSCSPPLAAKDVGTTLEIRERKDWLSLPLTRWQPDRYTLDVSDIPERSQHEVSTSWHCDNTAIVTGPMGAPCMADDVPEMNPWTQPGAQEEIRSFQKFRSVSREFIIHDFLQDPGLVIRSSSRSPSSKEPSPLEEEPKTFSKVISKTTPWHKRGKDARGNQRSVRACASCQASGRGRANSIWCTHRCKPTSRADDIRNATRPSNTARESGHRKLNQSYESRTTDRLDPRRPEMHANARDEITYRPSVSFGCLDKDLYSQVRDKSISTPANEERPSMSQGSDGPRPGDSDYYPGSLPPGLQGQAEHIRGEHRQSLSESLADAGDRRSLVPDTVITKNSQVDYAEDLMQSIPSRVLKVWETHPQRVEMSLFVPCNVQFFMEKQFAGSNKSLGRVIVLSGTATRGQATVCSDYIRSNWPRRGPWLLDILQDNLDGAGKTVKGHDYDLKIFEIAVTISSVITVDFIGFREAAIDVLQLLMWFGAAFQISSSDQLEYSESKLYIFDNSSRRRIDFKVDYDKSPVNDKSCWFSLFNNPVIAKGFPVPERSNSERGLELPIELMATLANGRHALDFEGGLVIKGHSIAFVPVKEYEDTIQWHMISNSDGTRLRYSDLRIHRALQQEVKFESIRTKRAILGWSQHAQTLLGTASFDYESIDWSEATETGRSTRLSGGGFGFQSNVIGQLNFALGAKDGRLLLSHDGPLVKIVDLAEKTPVVLYDHRERRAWMAPALEVILHVIHTRSCLNLYDSHRNKTTISYADETAKISDKAARRAIMASKDQQLYEGTSQGQKAYLVRDAVLDIWSLLERMMERDAVITSAPGVAVRGTMRDKLYGWEFRALVEDKSSFRRKEQVLEKSNGGWVDLVDDTDTIVLFGSGFQEVIKPVPSCSAWTILPKGKDYLAVGCPMLETLYNEAGSRKTRSYLTSRHLQWHRGSALFERCEKLSGCTCDRLQQLVYDSRITFGRVSPPDELPQDGCVIFGRAHHPMLPTKRTYAKQQTICSNPNDSLLGFKLAGVKSATHLPTTSLEFQPVRDQLPDGNDASSVFDSSSTPATDHEPEYEHNVLTSKRRRKVGDQDAGGIDSLNGRHKKTLLRRSSLLCILSTPSKSSRDMRSDLENKDNSEVRSVALNDKALLDQTPGELGGKMAFDNYVHCQSRPILDYNPEVGKGVETRHASMAVNCSK